MRKWITAAVAAGVLSAGMVGTALPAQAGNLPGKGAFFPDRDDRSAAERAVDARDKRVKKAKRTAEKKVESLRQKNLEFDVLGLGSPFDKEGYAQVVADAGTAYEAKVQVIEDSFVGALELSIANKSSSIDMPHIFLELRIGYEASLNAAADAYIEAVQFGSESRWLKP